MSRPWMERKGGIWHDRVSTKDELVVEQYDVVRDVFILIWKRSSDGYYELEYLIKNHTDRQWLLTFWENVADSGIFETEYDAWLHIRQLLEERTLR